MPRPTTSTSTRRSNGKRRIGRRTRAGGALLAVLWLSVALSAIAFSVATLVRGETERASNLSEGIRTYYLASGAVERAILKIQSDLMKTPDPFMRFSFPGGEAIVEAIPETAKLSLNQGTAQEFLQLALALGAPPEQAQDISRAIVDWRSPGGAFDTFYSSLNPSFRARHASFLNEEEALLVKGMTPDLFHGNYVRQPNGQMMRLGAFKDCVSTFGATGSFEVNTAEPALLVSLGVPPQNVDQLLTLRRARRIRDVNEVASLVGPARAKLRVGGNSIYTLRATARMRLPNGRLSDLRRTVSAQVKFLPLQFVPPHHVLRWRDQADSEVSQWP
ncbi:MAG: general secretion pathway protein GspK [Bryobacterales bacterium]|nr:general secretion pathway protein GspK [Bryobacterales bacterium]